MGSNKWKDEFKIWASIVVEEPYRWWGQVLRIWKIRALIFNRFLILSAILIYSTMVFLSSGIIFAYFEPNTGSVHFLHMILLLPVFIIFPVMAGILFVGTIRLLRILSKVVSKPLKPVHSGGELNEDEIKELQADTYRWAFRGTYSYSVPLFLLLFSEEYLGFRLNNAVNGLSFPDWLYTWLFGDTPLSILSPLISHLAEFPTDMVVLFIILIMIPGLLYTASIRRYFVLKFQTIHNIDRDIKLLLGTFGVFLAIVYLVLFYSIA